MTSTTVQMLSVATPAMPRGARVAANLFVRAARLFSTLFESQSTSRTQEAAEVRELAFRLRESDPRFAAELYAAADRHELLAEASATAAR